MNAQRLCYFSHWRCRHARLLGKWMQWFSWWCPIEHQFRLVFFSARVFFVLFCGLERNACLRTSLLHLSVNCCPVWNSASGRFHLSLWLFCILKKRVAPTIRILTVRGSARTDSVATSCCVVRIYRNIYCAKLSSFYSVGGTADRLTHDCRVWWQTHYS